MTVLQRFFRMMEPLRAKMKSHRTESFDKHVPVRDFTRYQSLRICEYKNLDEYLETEHIEGISTIDYGSVHLDLLVEDRGYATTVVIFHTALDPREVTTPVFVGQGLMQGVKANVICCSDPILERGIGLGWFAGLDGINYQEDLIRAIKHAVSSFTKHKNLVFYGPSGGGFAALFYSSQFPGSLAIPVNPQTVIDAYSENAVRNYCIAAWGVEKAVNAPIVSNLLRIYSQRRDNYVLYLQNLGDRAHIAKQLLPFIDELQTKDKVFLHLGKWGLGHRAPKPGIQRPFLDAAVQVCGDWEKLGEIVDLTEYDDPKSIQEMATKYTLIEQRSSKRKSDHRRKRV